VRWPNPRSPLLGNPKVVVKADGADVAPLSQALGKFEFTIADGVVRVQVSVEFIPSLPVFRNSPPVDFSVLKADQAYLLAGTTLIPDPLPFTMVNGELVLQNVHPLIDTISTGNAKTGLSIVEVRTEFVDVTEMWAVRADADAFSVFEAEKEREIGFVAIGATGSTPPTWFASFPLDMRPPTSEVGTLVFYRPSVDSGYTQPFNMNGFETQHALNRYLLTPRDSRLPMVLNGELQNRNPDSFFFVAGPIFLRASFNRAIALSGKPIVLLQPWPQGGTNVGQAATARLPKLLKGILRMLRGMGHIAVNHPTITPGRLGIAGYSAGGPNIYAALRSNRALVRELYLFDPMFLPPAAPGIIQWATKTPGFRLRMSGEVSVGSMRAIFRTVRSRVSGEAAAAFLSAVPETPARWKTVAEGGWPWWNFAISFNAALANDFNNHHQFVLYGGAEFDTLPDGTVTRYVPWMQDYLEKSGF